MKKIYYLKTCSTCQRILKDLGTKVADFELQNIKETAITESQLEAMKAISGSYEALFSRTAQKYKELGLKDKNLDEAAYKSYILQEYTFLKRPVIMVNQEIFIGSQAKTLAALKEKLS